MMKATNDLKKVSELDKEGKIDLLNRIKAGEIDPKDITSQSVIVSDEGQAFPGLMASVAYRKAGKQSPVVFIGKAKESMAKAMATIMEKRNEKKH